METASGFQLAGTAPERYERYVAPIMAPFVMALLDRVALTQGEALLDLACGTGFVARAAVPLVGPEGTVVGVDINPVMLDMARRQSEQMAQRIEWHLASAEALPFPADSFDAAVCQQGFQFFPHRAAAIGELFRVTRPGGRIALTFWSPFDRSPYFAAQYRAVAEIGGEAAGASFLDAFACTPAEAESAFAGLGVTEIESEEMIASITLTEIADFVPGHLMALPWGAALAEAHPDGLTRASSRILDLVAPFVDGSGTASIPFASHLISARLPD